MLVIEGAAYTVLMVVTIASLGYIVGAVRIGGIALSSSAIFLVALVFGHFGVELPADMQTMGMVLFMSAVGADAGSAFLENLRRNGKAYVLLCLLTAAIGSVLCIGIVKLAGVETPIAVGLMTGAYTTSPGFASAKEAFASSADAVAKVAAGYGVMYPVGTVSKVLFVQAVPKLLKADMDRERELIRMARPADGVGEGKQRFRFDPQGFFALTVIAACGMVLGSVTVPLPGIGSFALGKAGGPLLMGLLLGHLGHIGPVDLRVDPKIIAPIKEIGLILFFTGAGTEGGKELVSIVQQYGGYLLIYGLILTFVPLILGFEISRRIFRLPMLNGLAAMSGSMTCTTSLVALIQTCGTGEIASTYATIYPIALVNLVIVMQLLAKI